MTRRIVASVVVLGALAVPAGPAPARVPTPVPPQDCGFLKVKGKRYNVKADQMRCGDAEAKITAYFKRGTKPKGFTCQTPAASSIRLRCFKGKREFFAILR